MAGTMSNVTLGTGELQINGVSVGFLKGDVSYTTDKHILDFLAPTPGQGAVQFIQGSETIQETITLKAGFAEITVENFSHAIGEDPIVNTPGSPVTVTMQPYTMAAHPFDTNFRSVFIGGPSLTSVTVKDSTETTTYVVNTDYFIEATSGYIVRNPSGSIGASQLLHITATYTPNASKQVNLGVNFSVTNVMVDFIHTRPSNGKKIFIHMPIARAHGKFDLKFHETTWNISDMEFSAIPDFTNNPTFPLGYFKAEV